MNANTNKTARTALAAVVVTALVLVLIALVLNGNGLAPGTTNAPATVGEPGALTGNPTANPYDRQSVVTSGKVSPTSTKRYPNILAPGFKGREPAKPFIGDPLVPVPVAEVGYRAG